eukprot:m.551418 g.551418  ORF g.551418 m.551418 type:complete len:301 (-) comp22165_c0_seq29:173-1075(-)
MQPFLWKLMILCMTATMDGNDESPTKRPRRAVRECIFCATSISRGAACSISSDVVIKCDALYSMLSPAMIDSVKCDRESGTCCLEFAKQCDSFQDTRSNRIHSESTYSGHSECFKRFSFVLSSCKHCSSIERQKRATNCTSEQCCPAEMSGSSSHRCTLCGHKKQVSRRKRGFQHQRGQFVTKPITALVNEDASEKLMVDMQYLGDFSRTSAVETVKIRQELYGRYKEHADNCFHILNGWGGSFEGAGVKEWIKLAVCTYFDGENVIHHFIYFLITCVPLVITYRKCNCRLGNSTTTTVV